MVKITFLGTSDSIPSAERNPTSVLLTHEKENILVDCGEGTQRQIRKAKFNPCKITKILITHWHGDHVLGIPGLLQTLALSGYNKTLFIYGPRGTKQFMKNLFKTFFFRDQNKIKIKEVGDTQGCTPKNIQKNIFTKGKFFETDDFYLGAKRMTHGVPCNAYVFVRKGKRRIDKKKLKKSKLPSGPLMKKLKEGKDVTYKGKKYLAKNLTFGENDKKISFVFDTSVNKDIVPFVRNSDLLISESTFGSEFEERAKKHKHLTAKQAAEIAKKAKVKKLVLTHISQRYKKEPGKILSDAKKVFKNSFVVEDLDKMNV